jgi:hypothetical protein
MSASQGRNIEMKFRWIGDDVERKSGYAVEIVAASRT